ncbi:hypothetical protein [Shewanella youngdeokensis]|uniref:Porin n=1 Tax=Shewanella youngdeokensis TaxID=2999068 RepID=A0ABZ0JX36_9GAMM|nr:hypothetical protein RGE70_16255 [Shewanella sp. DAU334]
MNLYKVSVISLAISTLMLTGTAHAKVFKQATSFDTGYRFQIGDRSEASNQIDFFSMGIKHITLADWGSIKVKGKVENIFQLTETDPRGNDANVAYKTFADAYYNLSNSGIQAWWTEFSLANQKVSEFSNGLGVAYPVDLGGVKLKAGVAASYTVAHSPSKLDSDGDGRFNGYGFTTTHLEASFSINKKLIAFALWDARWDRDEDFKAIFNWDENSGHHVLTGLKYKYSKTMSMTAIYHYMVDWGAMTKMGNPLI